MKALKSSDKESASKRVPSVTNLGLVPWRVHCDGLISQRFDKGREEIHRNGKQGRRVMLRCDVFQRLQVTKL